MDGKTGSKKFSDMFKNLELSKPSIHRGFQLNGSSFHSVSELMEYASKESKLASFLNDWFSDNGLMTVQTSGSTGKPKLIHLRKEFMMHSALATGSFFNAKENTSALCCLPLDFIAGKMMVVRALTLGWHLDIIEPQSKPLTGTSKHYDFVAMVPLQAMNSLSELHRVSSLIIGGGEVSYTLQEELQNVPAKVYATYGMTETVTHIAIRKLNHLSPEVHSKNLYRALPDVTFSIDERNCLVIKAPKISEGVIITNDVVELISECEFEWKGRFDHVINSGGIKLHPEDIERKLAKVLSQRFFVSGIPDEVLGEKLVLVIEGDQQKTISSAIQMSLENLLSLHPYEKPKEILFAKKFVETETGKIKRKETLKFLN